MAPQAEFPTAPQSKTRPAPRRPYTPPTATYVSLKLEERFASCGCGKTPMQECEYTKWSHK